MKMESFNIKAEDFFKSDSQIKAERLLNDEEEERMFETKTVLGHSNFMLCEKCKLSQCRIKMSNEGFLFAACMGYPKCKNAIHTLTKNIRNIQMLEDTCD